MVTLELKNSDRYHILWLKYVTDVDLSQHCLKCLLGVKSKKVTPAFRSGVITLDESDEAEYYYLCGVVYPWNWANNFHCVFHKKEGAEFTYKFRNTEVHVINAEQVPISDKWINKGLPQARNRYYSTCRNWQFANWFQKNVKAMEKPKPQNEPLQLDLF